MSKRPTKKRGSKKNSKRKKSSNKNSSSSKQSSSRSSEEEEEGGMKLWQKVIIIVLIVVLAGSTLAAALIALTSSDDDTTTEETEEEETDDEDEEDSDEDSDSEDEDSDDEDSEDEDSDTDDEDSDDESDDDEDEEDEDSDDEDSDDEDEEDEDDSGYSDTVITINEDYEGIVNDLLADYAEDPDDMATVLALGRYYLNWGVYVAYYGDTDEDADLADDLLNASIDYYDIYLETDPDSGAVRTDQALALYYQEESYLALTALKEIVEDLPDYAPAWANLGLVYEYRGDDESALEAYEQAIECDPDDEYGAKSYAEERIEEMEEEAEEEAEQEEAEDVELSDSDSGIEGISEDLGLTDALTSIDW